MPLFVRINDKLGVVCDHVGCWGGLLATSLLG